MPSDEWSPSAFIAGALAGSVSGTALSPIEVVRNQRQRRAGTRTVPQIVAHIYGKHGWRGFYRGWALSQAGIIPGRGTWFGAYSYLSKSLKARGVPEKPAQAAAGALASMTSNTLTNPIWLLKTRVQLQAGDRATTARSYTGYADAVRKIYAEEGVRGFYKGLRASYWGAGESAIQFVLYEHFKRRMWDTQTRGETPDWVAGLAGGAAKLCASAATYPHEVVRLRMREKPAVVGEPPRYTGMVQGLSTIWREEGRRGLYRGSGLHLARTSANSLLMFYLFAKFQKQAERVVGS